MQSLIYGRVRAFKMYLEKISLVISIKSMIITVNQ